jgi:hypothetical protein
VNPPRANPNLARLTLAAERLAPLLSHIAFVGGCVTSLLITDPSAAPVRTTLDVDAIIQITSYAEFTELEHRLLDLGFRRREAAPICRWFADDVVLDLMPTDPSWVSRIVGINLRLSMRSPFDWDNVRFV